MAVVGDFCTDLRLIARVTVYNMLLFVDLECQRNC